MRRPWSAQAATAGPERGVNGAGGEAPDVGVEEDDDDEYPAALVWDGADDPWGEEQGGRGASGKSR